jgi:hypothetical protein
VLLRQGVEAYDTSCRSLGIFKDSKSAADAVTLAAKKEAADAVTRAEGGRQ